MCLSNLIKLTKVEAVEHNVNVRATRVSEELKQLSIWIYRKRASVQHNLTFMCLNTSRDISITAMAFDYRWIIKKHFVLQIERLNMT